MTLRIEELDATAVRSHLGALAELLLDAHASGMALGLPAPLTVDAAREAYARAANRLAPGERVLLAAFDGDELVGAAHFMRSLPSTEEAEISLEVADDHQHQGIGTRLLCELATLARRQGVSQLRATMLAENSAAVSLMRHFGWPIVSRSDGPELTLTMSIGPSC